MRFLCRQNVNHTHVRYNMHRSISVSISVSTDGRYDTGMVARLVLLVFEANRSATVIAHQCIVCNLNTVQCHKLTMHRI
jgi:hypothetical protein